MLKKLLLLFFYSHLSSALNAQNQEKDPFTFDLELRPHEPRSYVIAPLISFILPGFDQWYENQYTAAMTYSGIAFLGIQYGSHHYLSAGKSAEQREKRFKELGSDPFAKDFNFRSYRLGNQIFQSMGGLSSYHSFRSAAKTHESLGKFKFLAHSDETVPQILMAPFDFSYLSRPTTFVPLIVGLGLAFKDQLLPVSVLKSAGIKKSPLQADDLFFSSAFSFNAGTHEEAMFRGWIMPVMYEAMGDSFLANLTTSALFAAAHLTTVKLPIIQGLLGYHLGNVTLENAFSIKEAVFIHVWWDVIAFVSLYSFAKTNKDDQLLSRLKFSLPVLGATF